MNPRVKPLREGDPKKFQGWALKGFIGEGGQSTIYLAEKNGQTAALKMIRKEFLHNEKAVSRFFTEIKNLEMLNHPNIARVLEVEPSGSFLAIEFVDGPNLEQYLIESGPFNFVEWNKFAYTLAKTIEYCHSKAIIHKDISPQNIVIGENGPVLIDFGISYLEKDPRLTAVDETIGTPPFMSPEHFGISTPKEMDVFSLAGTLIFAATGHNPFLGETKSEWRESILFSAPDFSGLSNEQIEILSPLLYKNPQQRLSLSTFSEVLNRNISHEALSQSSSKELASVLKDSQNKLTKEPRQIDRKKPSLLKVIRMATLISLSSIGIAAFAIYSIQNNSTSDDFLKSESTTAMSSEVPRPSASTSEQNSTFESAAQIDNSPNNKEIQSNIELAKKFYASNQPEKALTYAKLAAEAGSANGMYQVAYILADQGKKNEAASWYKKSANLGYGDSFWNLGALYMSLGETELGLSWYEQGGKRNNTGSLNALGFYYGDKKNNYEKALSYYAKSANLGDVMGMANLGFSYEQLGNKSRAKEWYTKASDLGDIDASINLGVLFEQDSDWVNARKYYQRAADKKDPLGMYDLALILGQRFGQRDSACSILKDALLIKDISVSTKKLVNDALKESCTTNAKQSATPQPSATTNSLASDGSLQPVLKYSSSEYSEKLSSSLKTFSIFGRAYLSSDQLNWIIPLTNSARESVPPINRVQFRDSARPFSSWWNMPYELKDGGNLGWQAIVSNLGIQLLHSTGSKVCPEFRLALVQDDLVTATWSKTVEPCSSS